MHISEVPLRFFNISRRYFLSHDFLQLPNSSLTPHERACSKLNNIKSPIKISICENALEELK